MPEYTAGIIGKTGRGDYGHYLDSAFQKFPQVNVVAVADDNPEGLLAAHERTGAERAYSDFREMLEKEKLDLVAVGPRWADCHVKEVIAAAEAGVKGILCEKPLAATLAQADAMIDACERNGVRMVVAHRRACAYEQHAKKMVEEGVIGPVQSMRAHGKADGRAGSMDLMVLGTHMMDSMRYIAGADVAWAQGHVTQNGREITKEDVYQEAEGVGLVAGNGVSAYYVFENGITAQYDSYPGDRPGSRWFGFEIYGMNGILSLRNSPSGEMYHYPHGLWIPGENDGRWERILIEEWEKQPDGEPRTGEEQMHLSNQMMVEELIQAIEEDRDSVRCSSGRDARAAVEMVMAVHWSERSSGRVIFPLENRENPYEVWLAEGN
jgi:predicted dehydrogenase